MCVRNGGVQLYAAICLFLKNNFEITVDILSILVYYIIIRNKQKQSSLGGQEDDKKTVRSNL